MIIKIAIKKIYIGSDHAGFKLKQKLNGWLKKNKINYQDLGNLKYDKNDDYPDYAAKVAKRVVEEKTKGILICGSAQGVCIAANKIRGARAVVPFSVKEAQLARNDEDANIICLSGWFFVGRKAKLMIKKFLNTPFSKAKRHRRRLNKIKMLEK